MSSPKYSGGRRRIEKATTKEPMIADIEQENYPQHFKEHVKSKQPYQPKIKNRPAYKTSTTTSERPRIVETSSQSTRKSLFKPRVKVEKTKVTTSSSTTTTTSKTTRSGSKTKVKANFPQRFDIEKSTADNEILNNVPTEGQLYTTKNKFSAKFTTESPSVSRKNEDALRNVSIVFFSS